MTNICAILQLLLSISKYAVIADLLILSSEGTDCLSQKFRTRSHSGGAG